MAVDHKVIQLALRNRALQLAVTPTPTFVFEDVTPNPNPPPVSTTYIQEEYVPGPAPQVTIAPPGEPGAELEFTGFYILRVYAPSGTGISGTGKYSQGLLDLFKPGLVIVAGSDVIRIRSNPIAPYREQVRRMEGGRSMVPVNVPFRVMTPNN